MPSSPNCVRVRAWPARVGGREMSNRLVQRLLNDISDDPDQLPILQHALMRTWDYWIEAGSEGPVDLEHYQATQTPGLLASM